MARTTNGIITWEDMDLMVSSEGYAYNPDQPSIPSNKKKAATKSELLEYLDAGLNRSYSNNQLVNYSDVFKALSVSPLFLGISSGGGNPTFTITTSNSWTASEGVSWLSLSSTSGTGNRTITVTASANGGSSRSTNITVTDTVTGATKTISVSQSATAGIPTTAITLAVQMPSASVACSQFSGNGETIYIPQGSTFANTSSLYTNSLGSISAPSGWYSDGVRARNWNGSSFTGSTTTCSI